MIDHLPTNTKEGLHEADDCNILGHSNLGKVAV